MKNFRILYFLLFVTGVIGCRDTKTPIDRYALVTRNNPVVTQFDSLNSFSVGNGHFAFTADVTGLQTFPEVYALGIPLGTQSEWGWHSFPNPQNYTHDETLADTTLFGHKAPYSIQSFNNVRQKEAATWFRVNPHRLHLGLVGLELSGSDGIKATPEQLSNIRQQLNLWTGILESRFDWDGMQVSVSTLCSPVQDKIGARIVTDSPAERGIGINIRFPYPTGGHSDDGCDWNSPEKHQSDIVELDQGYALLRHMLDTVTYYVELVWAGDALLQEKEPHYFTLMPQDSCKELAFTCSFLPQKPEIKESESWEQVRESTTIHWKTFWENGGAIDFSACTDPRAQELERRVVLSQYLTAIQCTGKYPPAESGLTYNTWFGRPHLEMHWWHGVHFALWNRPELLESTLDWYLETARPEAYTIAQRQHYDGIRWMKMTDPWAGEAPSDIGSFLIWQQPHFIYFAEMMYQIDPSPETLQKYGDCVAATAEFMYSFAVYNPDRDRYELRGIIPAQETASLRPAVTYNSPFELAYWYYGLEVAQRWRERAGLDRDARWDTVLAKLSPLAAVNGLYVAAESHPDSFEDIRNISDHMAALGALGVLPQSPLVDPEIMSATFDWVWKNWHWEKTWGWDFPMTAMCAARLGKQSQAVDALLLDQPANTYLINGHNCRDNRLRVYLPGNGGLLTAVAMMCAGWDGAPQEPNPGFPQDGSWNVKWENLRAME